MTASDTPVSLDESEGRLTYTYRPRMAGAATRVVLDTRAAEGVLEWTVGAHSGRLPLKEITHLRLRHELGQFGGASYTLIIRAEGGLTLRLGSVSRTGLTGTVAQGPAFVGFLSALHAALGRERSAVRYDAGLPAWRWWLMLGLGSLTGVGVLWLALEAWRSGMGTEAAIMLGLAAVLCWPLAETLWRNTPGAYSPSAPPPRLLPG
ncbi:hypothetical protein GCM10007301_49350 [Azorhizobium oxalatiphilum]|uniref:Uncharacterized protein n=1 Tax=Azorhizobium oxalatiphilum TaxID=980631 RepID=A0A917CBL9_9HYPH|nr:hypothetical protein [Azorhizobium oxalatiphilum]GGF83401.1 hypothetical protein GCM10007301_49350 [Azorhizobium oxalatiphilum]